MALKVVKKQKKKTGKEIPSVKTPWSDLPPYPRAIMNLIKFSGTADDIVREIKKYKANARKNIFFLHVEDLENVLRRILKDELSTDDLIKWFVMISTRKDINIFKYEEKRLNTLLDDLYDLIDKNALTKDNIKKCLKENSSPLISPTILLSEQPPMEPVGKKKPKAKVKEMKKDK